MYNYYYRFPYLVGTTSTEVPTSLTYIRSVSVTEYLGTSSSMDGSEATSIMLF